MLLFVKLCIYKEIKKKSALLKFGFTLLTLLMHIMSVKDVNATSAHKRAKWNFLSHFTWISDLDNVF